MTKPKKTVKPDQPTEDPRIIELTQALQQERADSVNLRRRHEEQVSGIKDVVMAELLREMLPIIDNFERSLHHVPKDLVGNEYIVGINSIVKQFESTLEKLGVTRIKTVGELFDPKYHEAVAMEEGDGTHEIVAEELQPGYQVGDYVLRHAMVKVKMGTPKHSKQ